MKIKCVFFDIDGTLIDTTKGIFHVRSEHLDALRRLQQAGIYVVSATGRQLNSLKAVADFPFDANICLNGSMIYVRDRLIRNLTFDETTVAELWEFLENHQIGFVMQGESVYYCHPQNHPYVINYAQQVSRHKENQIYYTYPDRPVYKVSVFLHDETQKQTLIHNLDGCYSLMFYNSHLRMDNEQRLNGEITLKEIHKGRGVETVLSTLNIQPQQAIAFGDNSNDVEMFKVVRGYAMHDSTPDLIEHCTKVIGDVSSMTIVDEIDRLLND